jgi:hypothetical protein
MTKTDWTAEEVRKAISGFTGYCYSHHGIGSEMIDIATTFAERIEADESAVPGVLTADVLGSWCNILTHAWMYVQEGNRRQAWHRANRKRNAGLAAEISRTPNPAEGEVRWARRWRCHWL